MRRPDEYARILLAKARDDAQIVRRARDDSGIADWIVGFHAQQAAEKALKALVMAKGGEPWGHLTTGLAEALPPEIAASTAVLDAARQLDKHYIPARYPNGFADGYPGKLYTQGEAEQAIADASSITTFCRGHLPQ